MFKQSLFAFSALLLAIGSVHTPIFANEHTSDTQVVEPAKTELLPIVAVVKADWCPACKKVGPTMMGLMKDYGSKAQFVVLDVTNPKTTAEAKKKAHELGLDAFFTEYGSKTSTVAIIDPKSKKIINLFMAEAKREKYTAALDKILAADKG